MNRLQTIIPSKDRPAQLDLLLRTTKGRYKEWRENDIAVLWRASTGRFAEGYTKVRERHPRFRYVEEKDFQADFRKLVQESPTPYFQMFMDDDVLVRDFSLDCPEMAVLEGNQFVAGLVLRMAPYMDYCYTENVHSDPPIFAKDRTWLWPGLRGDWGYPNSVDGTIWPRESVQEILCGSQWELLHKLEPMLRLGMRGPLAVCVNEPIVVSIANNSVQDTVQENRNGGGTPEELNERFLAGEQIKADNIVAHTAMSPHWEIEYEWEPT
jgi:hypothetical protein